MDVKTYNQEAKEIGKTRLPKEIFSIETNKDLVHQVMVSQMSNRRQNTAHVKDRSEKRGGGRKPWSQKGTGRARHGSTRSPIWIGGGVTFGPRNERNYKKDIPKKMKRKALFMALTEKAKENIILLDTLKLEGKTKQVATLLKALPCKGSILVALPEHNKKMILAFRNIPKLDTIPAKDLNLLDVLNHKYLLMTKDSLKVLKQTFIDKTKK